MSCSHELFGADPSRLVFDLDVARIEDLALENINQRLALTGAQSKISVSLTPLDEKVRLTAATGEFILKPPPPKYPDFPLVEHATMLIVKNLGLRTAFMGLIRFPSGEFGYITRRFDRRFSKDNPKKIEKVSIEDFGQIFNRNIDAEKYRGSYNLIGKWLRQHSRVPGESAVRFFSQVFLSYLLGNNDFHLKNLSIYTENGISLTPIYDFVSTILIDWEPDVDLTLKLNGRDKNLGKKDWLVLGAEVGLQESAVLNIMSKFKESLPIILQTLDYSFLPDENKQILANLIVERLGRILPQ